MYSVQVQLSYESFQSSKLESQNHQLTAAVGWLDRLVPMTSDQALSPPPRHHCRATALVVVLLGAAPSGDLPVIDTKSHKATQVLNERALPPAVIPDA